MYAWILGAAILIGSLVLILSGDIGAGLISLAVFGAILLISFLIRGKPRKWFLVRLSMTGPETAITGPFNSEADLTRFILAQPVAEKSYSYLLPATTVHQAKDQLARGGHQFIREYMPQVEPVSLN